MPIDTVLASLSKYGFDVSADIQPDVIKRDAGSILKVEIYNNKSRIVLDQSNYNALSESSSRSGQHTGRRGFLGFFRRSSDFAHSNSKSSFSQIDNLSDQLQELNAASQNEAKWEIEGNKVVPKTLNVARIMRSRMKTTLTFNRIRLQTFRAPFERNFKIYTLRSTSFKENVRQSFCQYLSAGEEDQYVMYIVKASESCRLYYDLIELLKKLYIPYMYSIHCILILYIIAMFRVQK